MRLDVHVLDPWTAHFTRPIKQAAMQSRLLVQMLRESGGLMRLRRFRLCRPPALSDHHSVKKEEKWEEGLGQPRVGRGPGCYRDVFEQ